MNRARLARLGDLRRYAESYGYTHADFLDRIRDNPNDLTGIRAYTDWMRDQGLTHTPDFVEHAAKLDDPREYNYRFRDTKEDPGRFEGVPGTERFVSYHTGMSLSSPYTVSLWQKKGDGRYALWNAHGLTEDQAKTWEARLRSEGADVPQFRREEIEARERRNAAARARRAAAKRPPVDRPPPPV